MVSLYSVLRPRFAAVRSTNDMVTFSDWAFQCAAIVNMDRDSGITTWCR